MPCHHMAAVAVNGLSLNKFMLMIGGAVICSSLQDNPVTGKKADVIQAAYIASEIAHRMLKPGGEVCTLYCTLLCVC